MGGCYQGPDKGEAMPRGGTFGEKNSKWSLSPSGGGGGRHFPLSGPWLLHAARKE